RQRKITRLTGPDTTGRPQWSALSVHAQAVDEFGEAGLTNTAQTFRREDGADIRDALLDVAVDDHVIVFRPVAHLLGRFGHPRGDHGCAILRAGAQPRPQRGKARRRHEDGDEVMLTAFPQFPGALPAD